MFLCYSFANALLINELSLSSIIPFFDFKATIAKQHINKAELFYMLSNDSAKMAVYLSSS